MLPDTAEVRPGEELPLDALRRFLAGKVAGAASLRVRQFPRGHSNLVYLLQTDDCEYVLRRPPLGPVAPKAHDMAREYKVLRAVHPHFAEAPEALLICEDPGIVGGAFFVMERRRGVVIQEGLPAELAGRERCISETFLDCLIRLHAVDVTQPDVNALGKPEGFVERQVRGWSERWSRARTDEIPEMDRAARWLAERVPASGAPSIVHNDYKLDNVMLSPDGGAVNALLDWEMSTLGDPLADLGLMLCYWCWASRAVEGLPEPAVPLFTSGPGWYSRDEMLQRYARQTGRELGHIGYHEVLGVFKLGVILQQIYFRYRCGQTRDERFRELDLHVRGLARMAVTLMERPN